MCKCIWYLLLQGKNIFFFFSTYRWFLGTLSDTTPNNRKSAKSFHEKLYKKNSTRFCQNNNGICTYMFWMKYIKSFSCPNFPHCDLLPNLYNHFIDFLHPWVTRGPPGSPLEHPGSPLGHLGSPLGHLGPPLVTWGKPWVTQGHPWVTWSHPESPGVTQGHP